MHRPTPPGPPAFKWDIYYNAPLSGSLIVTSSPHSPKNYNNQMRLKFDDLGFKHGQFQRHES